MENLIEKLEEELKRIQSLLSDIDKDSFAYEQVKQIEYQLSNSIELIKSEEQ